MLTNDFTWSLSRAATFDECPRKYWLSYYGSWGGWASDAPPQAKAAYVLKKLKTRHMWAGEVVHATIERVLRAWRFGQEPLESDVEADAVARMRRDFAASRDRRYVTDPKSCALFEHHYGEVVEDRKWADVKSHVVACLRTFFRSRWAAELRAFAPEDFLSVEGFARTDVSGVPVIVKPDLAHRQGEDGVRVIDWKTGRSQGGPDDAAEPRQLALYGLYAAGQWGVPLASIRTLAANLAHGDGEETVMTPEAASEIAAHVSKSAGEMIARLQGRDALRNEAVQADFPMTDDVATCRRCALKELCFGEGWKDL